MDLGAARPVAAITQRILSPAVMPALKLEVAVVEEEEC